MPAAVIPFIPLIVGGATAGASIYSAHEQGQANTHAADLEAQGASQALTAQTDAQHRAETLARQQLEYDHQAAVMARDDWEKRNAGRVQFGDMIQGQLADLLHVPGGMRPSSSSNFSSMSSGAAPSTSTSAFVPPPAPTPAGFGSLMPNAGIPAPPQFQPAQSAGMMSSGIRLQAPDGSIELVAPQDVAHYLSRGAKVAQ